jgi:hypothetical protein
MRRGVPGFFVLNITPLLNPSALPSLNHIPKTV